VEHILRDLSAREKLLATVDLAEKLTIKNFKKFVHVEKHLTLTRLKYVQIAEKSEKHYLITKKCPEIDLPKACFFA
jgi:hypothetical protein